MFIMSCACLGLRQASRLLPATSTRLASCRPLTVSAATQQSSAPVAAPVDKLIVEDHNKVRQLFSEYSRAHTAETKLQLGYNIIRELSMHSSKEEEVVYPVIGKLFGPQKQQHLLDEHMALKVKLSDLSKMDTGNMLAYDHLMAQVRAEFEHHIKDEEENEIPTLLKAPGVDAMDLGAKFMKAAEHAVTRPHPFAPDKPPLNVVANTMTAPLDAVADKVRFGTTNPPGGAPPPPQ